MMPGALADSFHAVWQAALYAQLVSAGRRASLAVAVIDDPFRAACFFQRPADRFLQAVLRAKQALNFLLVCINSPAPGLLSLKLV